MSVYVCSDIHGHLNELIDLLEKAKFRYDGKDELHMLGDYTDFGSQSCETILWLSEQRKKYPFIQCYLGNHDLMFRDAIDNKKNLDDVLYSTWGINGGVDTYNQFLGLDTYRQQEISEFLHTLDLVKLIEVDEQPYYLAHAHPLVKPDKLIEARMKHVHLDSTMEHVVTWTRMRAKQEPIFPNFIPNNTILIHGHTMTHHICALHNIRYDEITDLREYRKIAIDCGGKLLHEGAPYNLGLLDLTHMRAWYHHRKTPKELYKNLL